MKIKIFTEGGGNIGYGHISRCLSLYKEIVDRGITAEFIVYGDVSNVDFLNGIEISNESWMDKDYLIKNLSSDDYAIVDSYIANLDIYEIISEKSKKVLYIDDTGRLDYPEGIIINPSLDISHVIYSESQGVRVISGPEYVILRPEFVNVKRENISNKIKRVLITMGGTDIRRLTFYLINNFCIKRPDIEFDIIIGSESIDGYKNNILEHRNVSLHSNLNAKDIVKLMLNSDLAITAAGQTIYELIATETPFIPVLVIENQYNNIKSLLRFNSKQVVFRYDDEFLSDKIFYALDKHSEDEFIQEQIKNYQELVDGYGSKRIVDILLGCS